MWGGWLGRSLEWDVKGQHKRVRGYREGGQECSTTLATKGRGRREVEAAGRNGHTQGGRSWGWMDSPLERETGRRRVHRLWEKRTFREPKGGGGWACMERRGLGLNAALWDDQKTSGGCNRRDGAIKAVRKLLRGKWNLGGLLYGGGGGFGLGRKAPPPPSARPQCAPPRPGALRAAAWPWGSRARAVPLGTEREGWGEGRSQGSEPCWGREGGRHTLGKRLGHIQNRPISKQSRGGVKGQLRPMKRKNTSEVRRKKRKKKSPMKQQSNPFGGLEDGEWVSFMSCTRFCPLL